MSTLKHDLELLARGVGVIHKLSPYNLLAKVVRAFCDASIPFVNLYLSAAVVDCITLYPGQARVWWVIGIGLAVNLLLTLIARKMDVVNVRKWNLFRMRYNMSLGEKAQSLTYERIEDPQTHFLITNIEDAMRIGNYGLIKLHSRIPLFVENFCKVAFSIGLIMAAIVQKTQGGQSVMQRFVNTPWADGILVLAIAISAASFILANRHITSKSYGLLGKLSKVNRLADYYLKNYLEGHRAGKDIRLYRQDGVISDELYLFGEKTQAVVKKLNGVIFGNTLLGACTQFLLVAISYLYVGVKALAGVFPIGSVLKYSGGIVQFASAFTGMTDAWSQLRANSGYLETYFRYADLPEESKKEETNPVQTENLEVDFQNVSFRYPGSEAWALQNVSLKIPKGTKNAIVGMNGSGKTTFIKLLCRLYQPTEGRILLGGRDIREYSQEEYSALFSVVFQDFKLFSFELGENVAGVDVYSAEKVGQCLEKAGLKERLSGLPRGLNTCMYKDFEEQGVEFSGGEAQKIALARALYKDAPIIVLDEPTAALDPIAEAEIYEKFNETVGSKTALYISHRMSGCRFCSRIIVFQNGRQVQCGSHEELLAETDGEYRKLWLAQAQYYTQNE